MTASERRRSRALSTTRARSAFASSGTIEPSASRESDPVLVLNAGSSSLKYQLVVPETGEVQAKGTIERIGEAGSPVADHAAAMQAMAGDTGRGRRRPRPVGLRAVGHRVVHGGPDFSDPVIIDETWSPRSAT